MSFSFKKFLIEEENTVFFTYGRMNPPTIGHGLLMDTLAKKAAGNPYRIYLSMANDNKKNPLDYQTKIKSVRKMFPKHSRFVILDKNVKNLMDAVVALYSEGFKNITMVAGEDRVMEFDAVLKKYNKVKSTHGFYNFNRIMVISAGTRDPDSDNVDGVSATKQREYAASGDFSSFSSEAKTLFNLVRTGMGLKESHDFRRNLELVPVSEKREEYVKGKLFEAGDKVKITSTGEIGTVSVLGSNYVIIETKDGNTSRRWITDVEKITEKLKHLKVLKDLDVDGDVDEFDKGTPDEFVGDPTFDKGYNTKKAQKKQKGEVKHALKRVAYESVAVDLVKKRISREKAALKMKHNSILNRAKTNSEKKK
jgi:nicotinic acid mononucleotide adenylyltransferase